MLYCGSRLFKRARWLTLSSIMLLFAAVAITGCGDDGGGGGGTGGPVGNLQDRLSTSGSTWAFDYNHDFYDQNTQYGDEIYAEDVNGSWTSLQLRDDSLVRLEFADGLSQQPGTYETTYAVLQRMGPNFLSGMYKENPPVGEPVTVTITSVGETTITGYFSGTFNHRVDSGSVETAQQADSPMEIYGAFEDAPVCLNNGCTQHFGQ